MGYPNKPTPEQIEQFFGKPTGPAAITFEIGLVLGGTVSAGAYTAGVLDFLIEALDEWTSRRDAAGSDPDRVPPHKTVIKLVTGTSGGGVNAAVLARALAFDFPHVTRATAPTIERTGNPFYDLWVNNVSLSGFLDTSDIDRKKFVSLLNGDVLDAAANTGVAFTSSIWRPRSWITDPLRVILTLTNLSGVPYTTEFTGAVPGFAESFVNHADYVRFAVAYPGSPFVEPRPDEFVLGFQSDRFPQALDWQSFGEFAKATSAFPLGFPARPLGRPMEHYRWRVAALPGDGTVDFPARLVPLIPDWAAMAPGGENSFPADYHFLVVDGGATDNEPIGLARTSLAGMLGRNPRDGKTANRGILLVDPFAGGAGLGPSSSLTLPEIVWPIVQGLVEQTRYDSSDILLALDDNVFSRFMIAPISAAVAGEKAIASAGFGAFIGFACRDFMRYDYMLGRANAQAYLKTTFVLDAANPIFSNWRPNLKLNPDFRVVDADGNAFLPIIPLMGAAKIPETLESWPRGKLDPESYRDAVESRFRALVEYEGAGGFLSGIATWALAHLGQKKIADIIINAMNVALTQWSLK
jgi:hypothetical protein